MISGLYASTSGLYANERRQAVSSANMANAVVPGYRRQGVSFTTFPEALQAQMQATADPRSVQVAGAGVMTSEVYTDTSQGDLRMTNMKTHVALDGEGFFAVQTEAGIRFTRNGSFVRTVDGLLQLPDGSATLLTGSFDPVRIAPETREDEIVITREGYVLSEEDVTARLEEPAGLSEEERAARRAAPSASERDLQAISEYGPEGLRRRRPSEVIGVFEFQDEAKLVRLGGSLYRNPDDANMEPEPSNSAIRQGFLEQSNVNITREMVDLIDISRAYEQNQRVIQTLDRTLDEAVNTVARI